MDRGNTGVLGGTSRTTRMKDRTSSLNDTVKVCYLVSHTQGRETTDDACERTGPTSDELAENQALKA